MQKPASKPLAILTVFSARTTGTPSPGAPTRAAMTTIDSDSMMVWVRPAMICGVAKGSSTLRSTCIGVAPKAIGGFDEGRRRRDDAEARQPDRGGDREDDGGDQARHHAEAEQDERRDQIDECRDGLHQVEYRPHGGIDPGAAGGGNAERNADHHADEGGGEHQRQGLRRFLPVALVDDQQQPETGEDGDTAIDRRSQKAMAVMAAMTISGWGFCSTNGAGADR